MPSTPSEIEVPDPGLGSEDTKMSQHSRCPRPRGGAARASEDVQAPAPGAETGRGRGGEEPIVGDLFEKEVTFEQSPQE